MTPEFLLSLVQALFLMNAGLAVLLTMKILRRPSWPRRSQSVCGGEIVVFEDGTTLLLRAGEVRVLNAPTAPPGYDQEEL